MEIGSQVRRISTAESGVVLRFRGDLVEVAFPGGKRTVPSSDLELAAGGPEEQLIKGVLHDSDAFRVRFIAQYLAHAFRYDPIAGLTNARIEPQPHQISVAHRVMTKHRPRMILADEVGLGKTIEAGLIIKEALARGSAERVLVVCPASLQYQWQFELQSKFNEDFEILTGDALRFLGREGVNPWTKADRVIASLNLAVRPERMQEVIDAGWDLIVFDEAHRVRRKREGGGATVTTRAYELADELKEYAHGVLLLTATPMQLDPYEFYSLIEIVEPGLFSSFGEYDSQRLLTPQLNQFAHDLADWDGLSDEQRDGLVGTFPDLLIEIGVSPDSAVSTLADPQARTEAIRHLSEKHPLASVMVRNRKAHLGFQSQRVAHRIPVTPSEKEIELEERIIDYLGEIHARATKKRRTATGFLMVTYRKILASSTHAVVSSLTGRLERLRKLRDLGPAFIPKTDMREIRLLAEIGDFSHLDDLGIDWDLLDWEIETIRSLIEDASDIRDAKLEALIHDLVKRVSPQGSGEKMLIFTGFRKTQDLIVAALRGNGYRVAVFNGSMNLDQKEAAVRDFRERAQVMVSTEAGGEGRNFQFASILVNYDLPWNPMVVEQRIGRLDRIGQKNQVQIYNLAVEGTIEEQVLDVLERRIRLFEESIGSLDPILGEVEKDIERLVIESRATVREGISELGLSLEAKVRSARAADERLRDFIMDESSYRRDETSQLLARRPMASWEDLRSFAATALEHYGGSLGPHERGGDAVRLSPGLGDDLRMKSLSLRGAFDPATALELEEIDFFAFGHEFVDRLIGKAADSDAVTGGYRDPTEVSRQFVEFIHRIDIEGARRTGRLIRHRIAEDLSVHSTVLDTVPMIVPLRGVEPPDWAAAALEASQAALELEFEDAQRLADIENDAAKQELIDRRRRRHAYERARLVETTQVLIDRIEKAERAGSEGQRRILPAWRGRLARDRDRLQSLDLELDREIEEINSRRAGVSSEVVSAAVVIGG